MDNARPGSLSDALARDRLGVAAVVFFVMSAAAPLTVIAGVVPTGLAVTGLMGIPIAFIAVAVVLMVFSIGYVAMARHVANAGAFYTFVSRGLGRPTGVAAAWVALLAYNALQIALYGGFGTVAAPLLRQWFGITVTWWVLALAAWALVAVLGLRSVDVNGKVLAILLVTEIIAVTVFSFASLLDPATGITLDVLAASNLTGPGAGALLAMAVLGFVGFEQSVVFSEESRDPRRTVPRATYLAVGLIAVLYALASWAMIVGAGQARIVQRARGEGPELMFNLAGDRLGSAAVHAGHVLFITSLIAAMISFHNTTARYAFALGREGVLPRPLGRTSGRTGAPKVGSMLQSALGLLVIALYAVAGWDPLVRLFFWGGTSGGIGVLLLITLTAVAVAVYFARIPTAEGAWQRAIAPALSIVALLIVCYLALSNIPALLGIEPGSPANWVVPLAYLAVAAVGAAWALALRRNRPQVYAAIGLGARSASATGLGLAIPIHAGREPTSTHVPR